MTTEEANVNRVKLKKPKTPKTQTEDTTSHKQASGRKADSSVEVKRERFWQNQQRMHSRMQILWYCS